jgi:hypothetical protein
VVLKAEDSILGESPKVRAVKPSEEGVARSLQEQIVRTESSTTLPNQQILEYPKWDQGHVPPWDY